MNENDTVDDDFATGLAKAIEKSKSEKTFDCKLSGIGKEMVLFESSGTRSKNLEKLLNALLTICLTSVSSERAFSVSGSIVVERRAGLKDETMMMSYVLNRSYTRDSTEGGACRSEFCANFMVIGPHWVEGLTYKKILNSVQPFSRYGHFWILALKWGQNWCERKKSPFFIRI